MNPKFVSEGPSGRAKPAAVTTEVPFSCVPVGTSTPNREMNQTATFQPRAHGSRTSHTDAVALVRQRKSTRVGDGARHHSVGAQGQFWTIVLYIPALVGAFTFSVSLLVCCVSMNIITVRV